MMNPNNEQLRATGAGIKTRVSGKLNDLWWAFMLRGLFALGLGVSVLIWPEMTLGLLVRLIGIYALIDGVAGIVGGIRNDDLSSSLVSALASLVVGAVLLFWPGVGAVTISWLVAGLALLVGSILVFLASKLRQVL